MRDVGMLGASVRVWILCAVCATCVRGGDAPSFEVKLSEGEVLEMASGEVAKAAALYREVLADANVQGSVRARALYLLARVERKLGNLKSAEELLQEIGAKHGDCAPFNERAAKMLKELRDAAGGGGSEWIRGLKENESIQAQLFQMAMGLVAPESDEGKTAAAKLLAMGPLAQPVLKTVMTTTRDPQHRRQLALVLAQMGDFEAIGAALDPLGPDERFARNSGFVRLAGHILLFDAEQKHALCAALDKLPPAAAAEEVRAVCAFAAADAGSLDARLALLEKCWTGVYKETGLVPSSCERHLTAAPQTAGALTALLRKEDAKLRSICFDALKKSAPAALTAEILRAVGADFAKDTVTLLWERKDWATLAALLEGTWAEEQASPPRSSRFAILADRAAALLKELGPARGESELGAVIRSVCLDRRFFEGWFGLLGKFFFTHEAALPELVKIVHHAVAGDFGMQVGRLLQGEPPPVPNDAFLGCVRALAVDPDPKVRMSMLCDWLGVFLPYDPALIEVLGRHLHDPEVALPENKAAACWLLLAALDYHPAQADKIAAVLVKDGAAAKESYEQFWVSPDAGLALAERLIVRLENEAECALCTWALRGGGRNTNAPRVRLPGPTIPGAPTRAMRTSPEARAVQLPQRQSSRDTGEEAAARQARCIALCTRAIELLGAGPKRLALSGVLSACSDPVVASPAVGAFLDTIIADRSAPLETRAAALARRAEETPAAVLEEFLDCRDAAAGEPIEHALRLEISRDGNGRLRLPPCIRNRSEEEKRVLLAACGRGPHKDLAVALARELTGGDVRAEILRGLTADEEPSIRTQACEALTDLRSPAVTALFTARLKDGEAAIRTLAVNYLGNLGGEGAMEALAGILDDGDPDVRKAALEWLRKLREQNEERELWKRWLEDRRTLKP